MDEKKDATVAKKLGEHDRNIAGKTRVFGSMQIYHIPPLVSQPFFMLSLNVQKKKMLSSNSHQFATVLYCMLYYFAYSISVLINDI